MNFSAACWRRANHISLPTFAAVTEALRQWAERRDSVQSFSSSSPGRARRWLAGWVGVAAAILIGVVPMFSAAVARDGTVVVASKIDTEGALLGNIILAVLRARGIDTESKLQLGPTNIV
ncbi:MAG: hypothetical protein JO182_19850, partial [Acidobacteriaceae bacterium]|nr:hypothetical protein [Acidobacteriaceae bacterium]